MKSLKLTLCALFTALIAIGAFIQIPLPNQDYFTLQFFFVIMSGMLLGPTLGATTVIIYLLIGLFGIPIFAAGGGKSYIFRPTFGFLVGFVFSAMISGFLSYRWEDRGRRYQIIAGVAGMVPTYAIGLVYKYIIINYYVGTKLPFVIILLDCFPIDIPCDFICCILAGTLMTSMVGIKKQIRRSLA